MTAAEVCARIVDGHKMLVAQKNGYSQDGAKRECVFTRHKTGGYYSDCSSSVRHVTQRADPSIKNIGSNTVAQYQNKNAKVVNCKIVNGVPTDIGALRVGDFFLFAGSDVNRAAADYVGHVEQVHSISGSKVMLFGHGSGTPTVQHEMVSYCKGRQAQKTGTRKGNRGLLKVIRFVDDDAASITPQPEVTVLDMLGTRILKYGMSGDDVRQLQRALRDLGFFGGSIGGNYLEITLAAVKAFQRKYKLTVDGEFGPKSLAMLESLLPDVGSETPKPGAVTLTTTGNVHIRVGPGTEFADVRAAKVGTKLTAQTDADGRPVTVGGWYAVIVDQSTLWVSGKYIKEDK